MEPQTTEPASTRAQEAAPPAAGVSAARLDAARRRVAALKGFYIHVGVFALVLAGLLILNSLTGGPWWVVWVFLGWGAGVLAHGLALSAPVYWLFTKGLGLTLPGLTKTGWI